MNPRRVAVVCLAAFAWACGGRRDVAARSDSSASPVPPAPPAPAAAEWVVRADGIGPVRVGVRLRDLGAVVGEPVRARYADFERCDFVRPKALPPHAALMVVSDTVVRVDVDSAGVRTAEGAQVGDTEAGVLALYRGRVRVEPHKYLGPAGHYLVVSPAGDTLHRIIFETDGQRVTRYRAGRRPAVELVEGCA